MCQHEVIGCFKKLCQSIKRHWHLQNSVTPIGTSSEVSTEFQVDEIFSELYSEKNNIEYCGNLRDHIYVATHDIV